MIYKTETRHLSPASGVYFFVWRSIFHFFRHLITLGLLEMASPRPLA